MHDRALHLLALLQPDPQHAARMADLAFDLGFSTQKPVRDLIFELKSQGWRIHNETRKGVGSVAWIDERDWEAVKAACEEARL